ncbi:hypothetical protein [Acrocarpospora sp. B8E8]|uniref:hypothetical protein n=1 Tax=Acrocarpospora sp. B8E8 TaxID=3153572 RepID=UPI00325D2908
MSLPDKYYGDLNRRATTKLLEQQGEINDLRARAEQAEAILRQQLDPYPCRYDHHGECQEHDRLADGTCMQARIRELLNATPKSTPAGDQR